MTNTIPLDPVDTRVIYDTSNNVYGASIDESSIVTQPSFLQIELVPSGTTLSVQAKIALDASWVEQASITNADGASILTFTNKFDFVRVVRTGTGNVKVFSQS